MKRPAALATGAASPLQTLVWEAIQRNLAHNGTTLANVGGSELVAQVGATQQISLHRPRHERRNASSVIMLNRVCQPPSLVSGERRGWNANPTQLAILPCTVIVANAASTTILHLLAILLCATAAINMTPNQLIVSQGGQRNSMVDASTPGFPCAAALAPPVHAAPNQADARRPRSLPPQQGATEKAHRRSLQEERWPAAAGRGEKRLCRGGLLRRRHLPAARVRFQDRHEEAPRERVLRLLGKPPCTRAAAAEMAGRHARRQQQPQQHNPCVTCRSAPLRLRICSQYCC